MVVLGSTASMLGALGSTVLLQLAMVGLDPPSLASQFRSLLFAHLQIAGGPVLVFRVPVFGAGPKYPHKAEALHVHHAPLFRDLNLAYGAIGSVVRIDVAVLLQAREEAPAAGAD